VRERVWVSARDGLGLDLLRTAVAGRLGLRRIVAELRLPTSAGRLRSQLHALDAVRGEAHDEHGWTLAVDLPAAEAIRLAAGADGAPLRDQLALEASP
jgi:GTP-binding protein HflX